MQKKEVSPKRKSAEQNILVEMKDLLLDLRQECIKEISERIKTLDVKNGVVAEVLSIAEQKIMLNNLKAEHRKANDRSVEALMRSKQKLAELQEKFSKIPE